MSMISILFLLTDMFFGVFFVFFENRQNMAKTLSWDTHVTVYSSIYSACSVELELKTLTIKGPMILDRQ